MVEIDNSFKIEGVPMRRFWLNRVKDQTGISRTGRVLEGVLCQNGQVIIQWRPPHTSIAIHKDYQTFRLIHVDCHPSCNMVVWLDPAVKRCAVCQETGIVYGATVVGQDPNDRPFTACANCKGTGDVA